MRLIIALTFALTTFALAENPAKADSIVAKRDSIVDTVYVIPDDGIPWNREHFNPERLVRHETFDPALKVAYTYSVSFIGGSFGSFAQQSYLAHLAYEFTPDLHLYADLGLWMPLYANFRAGAPIAKEDVRQGKVEFVLPGVALEYRPTPNTYVMLGISNPQDARKAYGPLLYPSCHWRNSKFCY